MQKTKIDNLRTDPGCLFTIGGDVFVDQLVVDTICIPEPATMSLLALGGLALLRRKRR